MDDRVREFVEANRSAAMITLRADGTPHAARVGIALVGDRLRSSGTQQRLRTKLLRRDPRCTLFVFETAGGGYLALETRVTIIDGPDAPERNLELFRAMQPDAQPGRLSWRGTDVTYDEFRRVMVDDQRLVYDFEVLRAYGVY